MFIVARPQIAEEVVSPIRSRFTIEPLEPGFGYTVGNSLRRTLLSSIPGAAISSIRIDGVLHEFSTVPKVTEDVTDVILNLKELVVRSDLEEPTTMYLKAKGPAEVTAGDVAPPAGVEILNPELHVATIGKGGGLEIEMTWNAAPCTKQAQWFSDGRFARISHQRDFRRPVLAHVSRININVDNSRVRGEGREFPGYSIIETHAGRDQKIALSHGHIGRIRAVHSQHVQTKGMH